MAESSQHTMEFDTAPLYSAKLLNKDSKSFVPSDI